jgi:hypothetical protein
MIKLLRFSPVLLIIEFSCLVIFLYYHPLHYVEAAKLSKYQDLSYQALECLENSKVNGSKKECFRLLENLPQNIYLPERNRPKGYWTF